MIIGALKRTVMHISYLLRLNQLLKPLVGDHALILGLHRVLAADERLINQRIEHMTPQMLELIVKYLRSLGYRFVNLEDIRSGTKGRLAVITFDDGFSDLYDQAFPVLDRLGVPFTVFLTTSNVDSDALLWQHQLYSALDNLPRVEWSERLARYVGVESDPKSAFELLDVLIHRKQPRHIQAAASDLATAADLDLQTETALARSLYLTSNQLELMATRGLSIFAHGHQHWSLPTLTQEQTETEVGRCLNALEQLGSEQGIYYAPAFGRSNAFLIGTAQAYGLSGIVTTEPGLIENGSQDYELKRVMTKDVLGLSIKLTRFYIQSMFRRGNR
jgi:peptidoglycan/xylan/chitin deacetylase (PgdA/CDA1 family)